LADDKVFLSSRAKTVTELIAANCTHSREVTDVLCELSRSKSFVIASEANNALKTSCSLFDEEHIRKKDNLDNLLKLVSTHLESKRQPFTKNSKLILKCLKEKIGEADLKSLATEVLQDDSEVEQIMKAFIVKKTKDSSSGFRAFLKNKKKAKKGDDEPEIS